MSTETTLADRIREEASQAARPGQMERLEVIASDVERLQRGAHELGKSLAVWMELAADATGSRELIDEEGDGDWGAVAERLAAMKTAETPGGDA